MKKGDIVKQIAGPRKVKCGPYGIVRFVNKPTVTIQFDGQLLYCLTFKDYYVNIKKVTVRPNKKLYKDIQYIQAHSPLGQGLAFILFPYEAQYIKLVKEQPEIIHAYSKVGSIYMVVDSIKQILQNEVNDELKIIKKPYIRVWVKQVLKFY